MTSMHSTDTIGGVSNVSDNTNPIDPIRVLHFADIHIGMENFGRIDPATGVNQRVLDFIIRLEEIVNYALEHEADLVIFAGDAFKTRDPNTTYQREFARQIMRLSRANVHGLTSG